MNGYIKLHRQIIESACFNDENPAVFKVWMYCLMCAKYQKGKVLRGGQEVMLESGQFIYSRVSWALKLHLSKSTLRNIMKKLEKWDNLEDTFKDRGLATVYQIKNWEKYQSKDTFEDTFEDNLRTTTGQLEDIYNNTKNEKKDKNSPLPPKGDVGDLIISEEEKILITFLSECDGIKSPTGYLDWIRKDYGTKYFKRLTQIEFKDWKKYLDYWKSEELTH